MTQLRTIVISPSHNEKEIMPAYVAHYKSLGADVHILDNHSTDGSDQLALDLGCTVEKFGSPDAFEVTSTAKAFNHIWRKFRRSHDVAILVDLDEFILPQKPFSVDMPAITRCRGYGIYSKNHPEARPLFDQPDLWLGRPFEAYSKPCILNLRKLRYLRIEPGLHSIRRSWPRYQEAEPATDAPLLFHLKFVGPLDYIQMRYKERAARKEKGTDLASGYGLHYFLTDLEVEKKVRKGYALAKPIPRFKPVPFSPTDVR